VRERIEMQRRTLLCGGRLAFIPMMPRCQQDERNGDGDGEDTQISRAGAGR
jgi:hypothetical protein